jgi:hypothetical protein
MRQTREMAVRPRQDDTLSDRSDAPTNRALIFGVNANLDIKARVRPKNYSRSGSVISGKGLTEIEVERVKSVWQASKARWEWLLHPDRNKWHLIK